MRTLRITYFGLFLIATILTSCNGCNHNAQTNDNNQPAKTVTVNPPAFNSDSAYVYTQKQVDFGPRNMNSKTHDECGKWLIAKLKTIADTVYVQTFEQKMFDGVTIKGTNIIASFNPKAKARILLTSHWDSRPWGDQDKTDRDKPILSACDGASGVGTLIEVANAIKTKPLNNIGVDIFMNDAEDYGYASSLEGIVKVTGETENSFCIGAQYWTTHPHVPGYKADFGILLDMAGARNAVFTREGGSAFNAGWVLDKVWGNAQLLGFSNYFSNANTPEITDDHHYINELAKIPTIDIIHYDAASQTGFGKYWHTHSDNMDIIDKSTLDAVGRTLLYTIYQYNEEQKPQ
jgi:glutaminyl-peptide cyclotransferase